MNQPLAAIVTNGAAGMRWLASETPNVERARESLPRIINEGNRASEVIKRIRTLSKKALPQKSVIQVNEVVHDVVSLMETELVRNQVALTCELQRDLPTVFGDKIQLQQVVLNLIVNAIEAMSGQNERIRKLLISSALHASGLVYVSVCDSGVGLADQDLERTFEAFFTTKPEGLGMGLSISRTIVESHGGHLWAERNQGARIDVSLFLAD